MKNRLLSLARKSIPYIKELRPIVGSVTACILWQQLDFHFAKKPDGFYKFLESCNNKAYKEGDSWIEELGFSKEEFRTAFKKIGITYKSKRAYDYSENKFKRSDNTEAWFCSYHDKVKGLTYYFRNHQYIDSTLDLLFANVNQVQAVEVDNLDLCKLGIPIYGDWESRSTEIGNPNLHLITSETTAKTSTKTDDRQTNTYYPCVNSKNDAKIGQSVVLDISNLNWPIALEQNQIVMKALTKLPDEQARQEVLDVVAKKLDNGTLQKPVSFLRKVVDNYLTGDFTPLEQTSRDVKRSSNKVANRQVYAPNECPYCDEQNRLTYEVIRTGEVQRTSCKHYHDTPEIGEKRGLRYVSPQASSKSQLRSIGEILGSRVKDMDEVPF